MLRFIIIASFLLTLFGCNKNYNPVIYRNDGPLVISGKITNDSANINSFYIIKNGGLPVLFTIEIKPDSSFYINIPVPDQITLSKHHFNSWFSLEGDYGFDSIQIADTNLRYARFDMLTDTANYFNNAYLLNPGKINNLNGPVVTGDYYITYYYFNSHTQIQGYYKNVWLHDSYPSERITEYNIKTKIGWNIVMTKCKSIDSLKIVYEVTDISSSKENWIIRKSNCFPFVKYF
jgi:hypothetical protein